MDILLTIKRLAFRRCLVFTRKAQQEMETDEITEEDVIEAIVNAHRIDKVVRSRSRAQSHSYERLYVVKGLTLDNVVIYTKGKLVRESGRQVFDVLISCKQAF